MQIGFNFQKLESEAFKHQMHNSIRVTSASYCQPAVDPHTHRHTGAKNGAHTQLNAATLQYGSPGTNHEL